MVAEPSAGGGLVVVQPRPVRQGEHHDTGVSTGKREAFSVLANPRAIMIALCPAFGDLVQLTQTVLLGRQWEMQWACLKTLLMSKASPLGKDCIWAITKLSFTREACPLLSNHRNYCFWHLHSSSFSRPSKTGKAIFKAVYFSMK